MQSGMAKTKKWVIEFEPTSKREPEPLMGWTSSSDTRTQVSLKFDTPDDAVRFAVKNGWEYELLAEHVRNVKPRNYSDNFRYIPPK
jgi:hypothetical protein